MIQTKFAQGEEENFSTVFDANQLSRVLLLYPDRTHG
jgi:hypothetical protein